MTADRHMASASSGAESFYLAVFLALAVLLAASPLIRTVTGLDDFGRVLDALTAVLVAVRLAALARARLVSGATLGLVAILGYYAISLAANADDRLFNARLFVIDAKILLFCLAIYAFRSIRVTPVLARRVSSVLLAASVCGTALFLVFPAGYGRIKLLDESNYTIVAFVLVAVCYLGVRGERTGTLRWGLVYGFLLLACVLAQSRTGFAVVALAAVFSVAADKKYIVLMAFAVAVALSVAVFREQAVEIATRGQVDLTRIDRFVFFEEYRLWAGRHDVWTVLFGNHIGKYIAEAPVLMQFWSEKQAQYHGIPYGLAPFNFHSMYLRLFADIGIVPAVMMLAYIAVVLVRSIGTRLTLVLFLAGVSMSVFYLSAVMPFVIFAQMVRGGRSRRPLFTTRVQSCTADRDPSESPGWAPARQAGDRTRCSA